MLHTKTKEVLDTSYYRVGQMIKITSMMDYDNIDERKNVTITGTITKIQYDYLEISHINARGEYRYEFKADDIYDIEILAESSLIH